MNAWGGLWRKEFRQHRLSMVVWIAAEIVFFFAIYSLMARFEGTREAMLALFIVLVVLFHIILCAVYLRNSLHQEAKRLNLWLHNPQPGYRLLLSKVVNAIGYLLVSMAISYVVVVFPFHDLLTHLGVSITRSDFARFSGVLFAQLAAFSVFLGIWVMFFWVVYRVMVTRIGKWAVAALIFIILLIGNGLDWFEKTALFSSLTHWGGVAVVPSGLEFTMSEQHVDFEVGHMFTLHAGFYVFWLVILMILFFLSSWLIDKKIEV